MQALQRQELLRHREAWLQRVSAMRPMVWDEDGISRLLDLARSDLLLKAKAQMSIDLNFLKVTVFLIGAGFDEFSLNVTAK